MTNEHDRSAMKEACLSFLSRCSALNLADGTLAWYEHILRDLTDFLASKDVRDYGAVTPGQLREYLAHLRKRGHASETVARTYGAIRCAFGFWQREGIIDRNPMSLVERPRRERVLIKPLSPDQAARLLAQPDSNSVCGLRDRALMTLLLDSGLRISEAIGLESARIDWINCTLTVMGKGRKERNVPFSAQTCQALLEYARERSKHPINASQFFLGRTGRPLERCKMRQRMKRYGLTAGIDGVRVSPHTLRHTFAVMYIRNGGDSFSLQEILGHSTLEMTRRYVNLARQDIASQHKKFSPVESLGRLILRPVRQNVQSAARA